MDFHGAGDFGGIFTVLETSRTFTVLETSGDFHSARDFIGGIFTVLEISSGIFTVLETSLEGFSWCWRFL